MNQVRSVECGMRSADLKGLIRNSKFEIRNFLMMLLVGVFLSLVSCPLSQVFAEEPYESVKKTQKGLHFDVPEDWPVEERNGVVAPIPIEEYLARKFSALDKRLAVLEKRLQANEEGWLEWVTKQQQRGSLQSGDPSSSVEAVEE